MEGQSCIVFGSPYCLGVLKYMGMLAFIRWGIEYKSQDVMLQLYKTLVRPHLEYSIQFWLPHYRKDVDALGIVQKRFTRMLPRLDGIAYKVNSKAEEEVLNALQHIKVDKSLGPDQVYHKTLWEAREEVAGPLAEIFVSSIATDKVPEDCELVNVVPLFKKG
eukprot:g48044.t1